MDHRKKSAAAAASLPDDALVEIFSCVPAKSLCRFRCVSKAWRDLISDRLRCNKLPQTLAGFFVSHDDEGQDEKEDVNSDRIVRGRFINTLGRFVPLASLSFLGKEPGFEDIRLSHSCNGLLLFGHRRDIYGSLGYVVCNPATEQWVAVPSSGWKPYSDESDDNDSDEEGGDRYPYTYLIFDPAVSSHFQLIQLVHLRAGDDACVEEVHTYSSETGVWCETAVEWSSAADVSISIFAGSPVFNGMLHLSATHSDMGQELMIAVDGEGKECKVIRGPKKRTSVVFVGQSQGLLHYMTENSKMAELSIWVLQDYDKEEWVLKHSVTFLQLFGKMDCQSLFDYRVVAIHPDRNLIFFVQLWDLKLISYDMDSEEICSLYTLRSPPNISPYVPYFAESSALTNKHRNCTL